MKNIFYFTDNYNKVIISDNTNLNREYNAVDLMMVQELCNSYMEKGYIFNPKVVFDEDAYDFLKNYYYHIACNYNATFYKYWNDILSKNRFELFIDQLCHYASTYGTNYEGETYVPNKDYVKNEELGIDFKEYKFIDICTETEAYKIALNSLNSGVALSENNLECLTNIIKTFTQSNNIVIDSDFIEQNVKNREAKVRLYDYFNIKPNNPVEILRLMIYQCTGQTTIINSKELLQSIRYSRILVPLDIKYSDVMPKLASIYHRFHKIFLMFSHQCETNKVFVNKLSRMAKKYHKPFKANFLEKCLDWNYATEIGKYIKMLDAISYLDYLNELLESLKKNPNINVFKAVKILNTCRERLSNKNKYNYYRVRNGKTFLKKNEHYSDELEADISYSYYKMIEGIMFDYVLDKFMSYLKRNNIKHITMSSELNIAVPTSEKTFLGTLPEFSYIDLSRSSNNMVGIYWRNEWGTRDFDLSCIFENGSKIGWNANYFYDIHGDENTYNDAMQELKHVFSGDMTDADPEASEVHMFSSPTNNYVPCVFYCNRYNGTNGSKFKLFFSQSKVLDDANNEDTYKSHSSSENCFMVDPSEVMFETMMTSNKKQQTLGVIYGNKFCFTNMELTNACVARTNTSMEEMILNIVGSKLNTRLSMSELICAAHIKLDDTNDSFTLWIDKKTDVSNKNNSENENVLDLNLKNISKDTICNCLI